MTQFGFKISAADGAARSGEVTTAHGSFQTPAFMMTATVANANTAESEISIYSIYHLMLRPGVEQVAAQGGLHKFVNFDGAIATDSGSVQTMLLSASRKVSEKGISFRSHIDGAAYELTPERSIEIQQLLGGDIAMCLDESGPHPATFEQAASSMRLSLRWAERSKAAFKPSDGHALFAVVQGGSYPELRQESAMALTKTGFDGYAIGSQALTPQILDATVLHLPADKLRYLMSVDQPADIINAVQRGIDLFDGAAPINAARAGRAYTCRGAVDIHEERHAYDTRPLDDKCSCSTCTGYSRAYLHHLFVGEEVFGPILLTTHNLHHYQELMEGMRQAIKEKRLESFAAAYNADQALGDIPALSVTGTGV